MQHLEWYESQSLRAEDRFGVPRERRFRSWEFSGGTWEEAQDLKQCLRGQQGWSQCSTCGKLYDRVCHSRGLGCYGCSRFGHDNRDCPQGESLLYFHCEQVVDKKVECLMVEEERRVRLLRLFWGSPTDKRVGQEPSAERGHTSQNQIREIGTSAGEDARYVPFFFIHPYKYMVAINLY